MLCCKNCKVQVAGDLSSCPLCQGPLVGTADPRGASFPLLEKKRSKMAYFFSWVTFGAIAAALVCFAVDIVTPGAVHWSFFAVAGIVCAWISVAVGLIKKTNLMKTILWQLLIVTVLAVIWDAVIGWYGWSLDYVLPCSAVAGMVSMVVLHKVLHLPAKDYIIYLILGLLFGIIPLVFLCIGMIHIWLPSVLCIFCSLLLTAGLLLFQGYAIRQEVGKKLHV